MREAQLWHDILSEGQEPLAMKILTAAEMRDVDRLTTERYGIPSLSLMENAGKPLSYAGILRAIWGPDLHDGRERLRVVVNNLRKKVEADPHRPKYILTDKRFGYRFCDFVTGCNLRQRI